MPELRRELGLRDLVLFNIAAVVGIRWLAAAAHTGPGSLSLWVLAAAFFFVPLALAVSRLSSRFPEQGGLYAWTRRSYGDWHGFLCGWCYWLSNLFWIPNLLVAGLAMAAYTLGPQYVGLSENRWFVISGSLVVLWISALTNLVGLRVGKWTENVGALASYLAGLLLVVMGVAVWRLDGPATQGGSVLPAWSWENVNFWSQIALAFGGLELGAVMGGEIRDPARTVRRAAWISGAAIAVFYMLGTLAMLVLVAPERINIVTGLAQAGAAASERLGVASLGPLFAALVTLGITGQLGAWIGGSARVPFAIGLDRHLPPAFARLHPRWGTPHVAILTQAAACTAFLLAMQLGESLRIGYQLLVDMTVVTYFIPFGYLFLTAMKEGLRASGAAAFAVTVVAIAVSLVPPAGVRSLWLFEAKLIGGCALLIAAGRMCFRRGQRA